MSEQKDDNIKARMREARKYQRMAIEALIPESQKEHMDIIEKEIKTIVVNGMLDLLVETGTMDRVMKYAMEYFKEAGRQEQEYDHRENDSKSSTVRKVVIGE